MKTIHLKISDNVYDKFLWLLGKFSKDEIQIIDEKDSFTLTKKYLENELFEIENGKASFVSESELEDRLNNII
ncbi:MAG: tRNA pseudouridine synthase A [Flavobacteriia bacterium]|nr:tRNA pseudouridine synthase A [Flavobacteriia bacterium]OIP48608.1 MAG: tRNA pseudouridine synthase A [Flavobacteriaceae bacterium CG2_30_31_66]PIV97306.1 MAG: tRNA pseudouridine synthase A [Flavobacteriaceae bacterium CG17_big_fil_post_rev_8_21_14_2_50_31_13]PIY14991.1 MAG: tRNA pseudouridine synthase A [Flavobacteriaceae bacterium CG_4_10_14_3_um_filter_31_253]PIZ09646.1 MAG: tRNA pseudouridine synthase A [Flavobacteriaceae bacterium CG_4_10_14_0_8_um_filter_31_99]PJC10367.1 MAG: tRNA pse